MQSDPMSYDTEAERQLLEESNETRMIRIAMNRWEGRWEDSFVIEERIDDEWHDADGSSVIMIDGLYGPTLVLRIQGKPHAE